MPLSCAARKIPTARDARKLVSLLSPYCTYGADMKTEKLNRDLDNLTPLDARNSLLMDPTRLPMTEPYDNDPKYPLVKGNSADSFMAQPANPYAGATPLRSFTPQSQRSFTPQIQRSFTPQTHRTMRSVESQENLVQGAALLGGGSPPRQPATNNPAYGGYRGARY